MYILCHNKVLIVRHFLVRITYCTCVFVVCFVIMALHSLLFFRLIWKRYWRRYAPTTWKRLIATCGSSSLSTGTTKNSSPPDDLQLPTRVKVVCIFCHAVLISLFKTLQNIIFMFIYIPVWTIKECPAGFGTVQL